MKNKVLLIILDGQPWRNARRLNGNLEGWVHSGAARVWKMRSVLPSTSACCYASIHTGVTPQRVFPFIVSSPPHTGSGPKRRYAPIYKLWRLWRFMMRWWP